MLCEECHEKEAVYTVSVVVDGDSTVRHLCADCMARMNENIAAGNIRSLLSSILSAITGQVPDAEDTPTQPENEVDESVACSRCGTTLNRFTKSGRLGCPGCYDAFRDQLQPMLEQIHGRVLHAGRQPLATEDAQRSRSLREDLSRQMEQAIAREDFETAAELRDQIRSLAEKEAQV